MQLPAGKIFQYLHIWWAEWIINNVHKYSNINLYCWRTYNWKPDALSAKINVAPHFTELLHQLTEWHPESLQSQMSIVVKFLFHNKHYKSFIKALTK